MQKLTPAGENLVNNLASRYNISTDAVVHMLVAVNNGGGSMAQFNSPELGGSGQWMRGGMTMVGDMFNNGLRNTVDNLCSELSDAIANMQIFPVIPAGTPGSSQWWPADLGSPFSSGGQNNTRYAVFPGRLAVELNGEVTVYDTLNHNIGGVSQQQGGNDSLTFSSQFGTISVNQLPVVSGQGVDTAAVQNNFLAPEQSIGSNGQNTNNQSPAFNDPNFADPAVTDASQAASQVNLESADEVIELISKLAKLREAGAISQQDFDTKKQELLARI